MKLEQAKRQFDLDKSSKNAAILIVACMRSGLIPEKNVRYCASLGDEVCRMIFPNEQLNVSAHKVVWNVLKHFSKTFCVQFAVWASKKSLHIFEEEHPEDNRPRLAIEAAENWLEVPSEENMKAAEAASSNADSYEGAVRAASNAAFAACTFIQWSAWSAWSAKAVAEALGNTTDKELLIEYLMKDIL